jgi:hypothetical protein
VQGLPGWADESVSAVVAVLQLSRVFSRLYADTLTRGSFNVVFLLAAGGASRFDNQGVQVRSRHLAALFWGSVARCCRSGAQRLGIWCIVAARHVMQRVAPHLA